MPQSTTINSDGNIVTTTTDSSGNVTGRRYSASPSNTAAAQAKIVASMTPAQQATANASLAKAGITDPSAPYTPEQMVQFYGQTEANRRMNIDIPGVKGGDWIDPTTGQPTPIGIGIPAPITQGAGQPPVGATYIDDPAKLSKLREEQIYRDPNSDKIYQLQQATLTSPTGEKRVVSVGSTEANNLLASNWTLGDKIGGGTVDSNLLADEPDINIGTGLAGDAGSEADGVIAGSTEYSKQKRKEEIADEIELNKRPEDSMDLQLEKLWGDYSDLSGDAKSFETIKAEEKAKAELTAQKQELSQKMDEIDIALAKSRALDTDYRTQNQLEEGRPQTTFSLRGQQAQNYKMYLARKNDIASDVALLTAEGKAIEGKYNDAIELTNDAINLRYQSQQDSINNKVNMINILIPQINKKDLEYATALKNIYDREAIVLADKKELEKYEAKKKIDQKYGSATGSKFTVIGQDEYGNNQYGFVDESTQKVTPYGSGDPSSAGVVTGADGSSYDILSYATDPNHESNVQSALNRIGKMDSYEQMDSYIQQVAPGSQVTGEMIGNASEKHGVSWEAMMAIMEADSSFGTAGAAIRSMNPGNVGNTEQATSTGQLNMMGSWQEGVDAVAKNLAWRRVEGGAGDTGTYNRNHEFTYNEKVDTNRLPKIGGKLITNKTARMGNLPYGITDKQADWIQLRRPGNIEFQKLKTKEFAELVGLFELKDDISEIRKLKEQVNTGWLSAADKRLRRFTGAGNLPSWLDPKNINEFTQLEVKTGKELAKYIKSISGAAVSEQEAQRLGRNVPNVSMQDKQFLLSLDDYEDDMNAVIEGKIAQYDIESVEELRQIVTGKLNNNNQLSQDELSELDSVFSNENFTTFDPANYY